VVLPICRRFPAALRRSRVPLVPPALQLLTVPGALRQILPMARVGRPQTLVIPATRCGARARPTRPASLLRRCPIRSGPSRPTRGSPQLPSCLRLAWGYHNGRMLRLPRRCSMGASRSPPPSTMACGNGASGISETGSRCSDPNARGRLRPDRQNPTPKRMLDHPPAA
jgi:hypothetical protein